MKVSARSIGTGACLVAGAFCAGWLFAATAADPRHHARSMDFGWPRVSRAGETAGDAGERFASLGYGRAPVAPSSDIGAPPPPPPPDISVLFRRDLAAIERQSEAQIVWIIDLAQLSGRRGIRTGDLYRDGWRVSAISAQYIELRKGRDVRRVAAFDLPEEVSP